MKRLLALVLSFCLMLSCLPFGAIALEAEPEIQTEPQVAPQSEEETQAPEEVPAQVEEIAPVTNETTHASHGACICAVKGSACSHEQLTWTAWESTTSLPTEAGNYYLTGKVTLAAATTISANVKICLNGFDVDLNQKRIVVNGGGLTIMNCQAQLNAKNQLTSTAGRVYNGASTNNSNSGINYMGGAIGTKAPLTLIAIHLDNNLCKQASDARSGGAIYAEHTTVTMESCSFKDNKSDGTGGVFASYGGSLTVKDCLFTNNHAVKRGGAIAVNTSGASGATNLTIGGNSEFTGNYTSSTGSTVFYGAGGAIFAYKNGTTALNVTIEGNTKITGNTASQEGGGLCIRNKTASSATNLIISGNVQISGNAGEAAYDNLYFDNSAADSAQKVTLGNLGAEANIQLNLKSTVADPDAVLAEASGAAFVENKPIGVRVEDKYVGHNATDKFCYVAAPPAPHKAHGACICAVSDASCSHEQLTWTAWESTTSLPTEAGNYYLTGKVTVAANVFPVGKVNICLNGFSIDMNEKRIEAGNGDDVTILNCQATLKANGQLAEGNAKIHNGKHTHGAAVMTAKGGKFTAIGVEFADNNNYRESPPTGQGGGAVYFEGEGALYACRFVNNTSNNCGGAVAVYVSGNVKIDDCYFSGNSAASGGALSVYTGGSSVTDVVATLTGDNEFVDNEGDNGGALYIRRHANTPAAYTARIILEDNCRINGNNAKTNGGAVYIMGEKAAFAVSDNAQIIGNTAAGKGPNVYVWEVANKITVGELGSGAAIGICTGDNFPANDPDEFLVLASGVNKADTEDTGIFFDKVDPALVIGYNSTEKFYFVDNTVYEHDDHGMCSCVILGDTCSHSKLTWKPWKSKTGLPTAAGNYFLTADVTLAAITDIAENVNICLNGYNINLGGKKIHNTGSLGIMNCQAAVNNKNQLTSTTGKIYGGDGSSYSSQQYGGAISTFGQLKLIGVWFADNTAKGADARTGGALYVENCVATIESCKFSGNKALSSSSSNKNNGVGGAISVYKGGSLDITDTVFENNTADLYGGAICVNNRYATADSTVTLDGNCEFTGNKVNSVSDGFGAALYLYARSEDGGKLTVNLGGNTKITGNTAGKFGAVYLRTHDKAPALNFVAADNVNICDNTAADAKKADLYMQTMKQKVQVGQLGANFRLMVGTPAGVGDPDEFVTEAGGVKLPSMQVTGIFYTNTNPAVSVGHSTDDAIDFYFDMAAAQTHTDHSLCDCFLSGESCADSTLTWKAWIYDDQLPTTAGNWYLTCDVKVKETVSIKTEGINVCLNGFNVDLNEKYISVGSAGALGIINCKAAPKANGQLDETKSVGGKITNGKYTHGAAVMIAKGGKFTAIGVEFSKNTNYRESPPTGQGGGAVYAEGAAELYACRFADNTSNNFGGAVAVYVSGSVLINDCCFTGNSANHGGALSVYTGGSSAADVVATLTGDNDFVGNTAQGQGGAIMIRRHENTPAGVNPKLETKGNVKITENVAVKDGGGIAIIGTTTDFRVDLNGTVITKNKANRGGGIFAEKAKLVGTTITVDQNSAEGTGSSGGGITGMGVILSLQTGTVVSGNKTEKGGGGGIYVSNASTVNLWGCTISKNESPDGGGVRLWRESVLNLKGGKIIENNSTATGGGVSLVKGSILNMESGEISKNTSEKNGAGVYADNYFQSADPEYDLPQLNLMGGKISGNTTKGSYGGGIYAKNCQTKISGTVISGNVGKTANGGGIYASRVKVEETTEVDGETIVTTYEFEPTFEMTSGEISGNKTKNGAGIYFNEVSGTISGGKIKSNKAAENAGGISVRTAKLTFKGDAEVSNNTGKSGGGIILQVDSSMDMLGGTIKGNSARNGGGILLWSRSVLNMRGGRVNSNKATKGSGGGIFAQGGAHVRISGGTVGYNTATSKGGGIYVTVTDKRITRLTVSGGTIIGNYAKSHGGGAYVYKGSITNIYGGTWKSNEVTVCGGGIYADNAPLNLYGGTFTENHAEDCGGAINAKACKVLLDGAIIKENISDARGGGLRLYNDCEFIMKSGEVIDNEAARGGGGIAFYNCKSVDIEGGKITGNKVLGSELYPNPIGGGGIAVYEGGNVYSQLAYTINISGGEISDNYSLTSGGGVFLSSRTVMNFTGGKICNNTAEVNGGGITVDPVHTNSRTARATLNVTGGEISGNSADYGGGIYACSTSEVILDGATIDSNTATSAGGAVYLTRGTKALLKDSLLTKNTAAEASGFYAVDDLVMHNLEVTKNNSKTGYAVYIDKGEFDGRSYVLSIMKMSGDMRITDNNGGKGDLFLGQDAKINIGLEGLGKNTLIDLELETGVLTNTIIGAYNYEGGDRFYTVTYGERSMTDLEPIPTEPAEQPEETPATEPAVVEQVEGSTSIVLPIVLGVAALAIVLVVLIWLVSSKNKKKNRKG